MSNDAQKQVYDNLLKRLIENQFAIIIPLLFSALNPTILRELTIEALLPPRRMDRVYLLSTPFGRVILHIEIEAVPKGRGQISRRVLVYHSLLLEKYNQNGDELPVITVVLYPFDAPGGEPELIEVYGEKELLRFSYQEVSLRKLDARTFVQARAIPLYGLLPAMDCTSEKLLLEALEDMLQYYRGDEDHLRDELLCFQTLLLRARRLPDAELEKVLRRIRMFDPLLETDPWVQEYGHKREVEGEARGEARGKAEGIRQSIEMVVQTRFPHLLDLAMDRVARLHDLAALQRILVAMSAAHSERAARRFLQALQDAN
jgi:predicted transposase YdaD